MKTKRDYAKATKELRAGLELEICGCMNEGSNVYEAMGHLLQLACFAASASASDRKFVVGKVRQLIDAGAVRLNEQGPSA